MLQQGWAGIEGEGGLANAGRNDPANLLMDGNMDGDINVQSSTASSWTAEEMQAYRRERHHENEELEDLLGVVRMPLVMFRNRPEEFNRSAQSMKNLLSLIDRLASTVSADRNEATGLFLDTIKHLQEGVIGKQSYVECGQNISIFVQRKKFIHIDRLITINLILPY